eukprot:893204-Karenia_brevis.AAC.1
MFSLQKSVCIVFQRAILIHKAVSWDHVREHWVKSRMCNTVLFLVSCSSVELSRQCYFLPLAGSVTIVPSVAVAPP